MAIFKGAAGQENDVLLEKVERWIRYTLVQYSKEVWANVKPDHPRDSFLPPEVIQGVNPYFDDFVNGKCDLKNEPQNSSSSSDRALAYNISNDIIDWYLFSKNEYFVGKVYGERLRLEAFFGDDNDEMRPRWIKTLLKFSNMIGWQHFSAFYAVYKIAHITEFEASAFGGPPAKYTKLDKLVPFGTRTGIDIAKIEKTLNEFGYRSNRPDFREVTERNWGQELANPLLRMVLYQTLYKAIADHIIPLEQLGGMTRATMTPQDYEVYQIVHKHSDEKQLECYEGMPRWDYVVYWLRRTYDLLKQNYQEKRPNSFPQFIKPMSKYNEEIKALSSEWAKYVSYWDQILETVEKEGVQKLDPTIDLFGPSEEQGEANNNE